MSTLSPSLVYIDDVLTFSSTFEQHLKDVDEVLNRFRLAGLKLKPSKCIFAANEVDYLGFKISDKGIQATDRKIEAVLGVDPPDTAKKLFSFLCSMNYYRLLIPQYGKLTTTLYKMTEAKEKNCVWTTESLAAFEALKQALVSAPILMFPNFKKEFCSNRRIWLGTRWCASSGRRQKHATPDLIFHFIL